MRQLRSLGTARRWVIFAALLAALAVLAGSATIGRAATNGTLTSTVTVLNDQSPLVLGTPTPGKNIGYELKLSNDPPNTNTLNHIAFTDTIGNKGTIVYLSFSANASCSGKGTSTLSCTGSQLAVGEFIDVIVLFSTDPKGTGTISNVFTGTYAPASNNNTNNRTDPTKKFTITTDRQYADSESGGLAQSLTLPGDLLSVATGQFAATATMPSGQFLHDKNYVGVTLETLTGTDATPPAGCTNCVNFKVKTTIPLATAYTTTGPFGDGTTTDTHYYTWKIFVPGSLLDPNFKPVGVWHTDNDGGNSGYLPACATDASGNALPPTSAPGLCVSSITTKKNDPNFVTYSGIGVNNGNNWAG